ncbi:MAG: hypothetical protein ABI237_14935 [Ginsengibacter sp.]
MADESTNKTISSTDSGFPGYLDFEALRSDAIAYLGNLSGKIWTDYNVHDPGITILEALIYAVLDLGYRTNLPTVDLFTRNPDDKSDDNNFFTPSQILANNPLTITDFRKLLIDIKGVKNAWLETEDKLPSAFCKSGDDTPVTGAVFIPQSDTCDCDFLNGLYHVYIELEDFVDEKSDEYKNLICKIKCALMSRRNLCEDFIDIKVLCKLKLGLCADIELQADAVGEDVYLKILEALREFFSPSPKFYTLPQLLDKGKPIDEIFAGRPYNLKESYGFVDTDEFEKIELRRKMHLSDVYHVLFDIDGVKNVRNLAWKLCGSAGPVPDIINKWELHLPENFIPEFDVACSGFQFYKYGMKVKMDTTKANSVFALNFSSNGKILHKQQAPYLDMEIPQGVYRSDLADYHSIQNEFPHVYGIKKGDLASNASVKRKAQALQLQGFLLFFDQLLANYLGQLKNMRSLFAMSFSESDENNHTYYTNTLGDVPQLEKLVRFNAGKDGAGNLGTEGSILAYPTSRKNLEDLIASGKIQNTDLDRRCNDVNKDDFPPYQFCYGTDRDLAEKQLIDDLLNDDFEPVIVANYNDCYFFYCFTSSTDFALISKKYYACEQEAQTAAASIKYLSTFVENYRSFLIEDSNSGIEYFSFDLEFNLNSYPQFLKLMSENPSLYNSRRQGFLNHLLSRFAEQFTDYALLSGGFLTPEELQKTQIKAEEKFLANYPELSSNRSKGYDYKCHGWNSENISGFEKRVKALSGIDNWKKHYLCNFVVEKADEIYKLSISLFGSAFTVEDKMFTYEAGHSSLNSLYKSLGDNPHLETEFINHEQKWSVFIKDDFGNKYSNQGLFDTKEEALKYDDTLHSVLSVKPDSNENVFVSKFVYRVLFNDYKGEACEESKQKFNTPEDAQKYFDKIASRLSNYLNNSKEFSKIKKRLNLEKLIVVKNEVNSVVYIDKNKFQFKPIDVIQLDTVKKKFALLNDAKTIQFDSLLDYDTIKLADKGFEELLRLLVSNESYSVQKENSGNIFKIIIKNTDVDTAVYFQTFTTQEEAENKTKEIFDEIISHTSHLSISEPIPDNWEFQYELTNPSGENIDFKTKADYTSEQQALAAAKQFYSHISTLQIKKVKNDLQLFLDRKKKIIAYAALSTESPKEGTVAAAQLLNNHQELFKAVNNPTKKFIDATLAAGKDSAREQYIYKLVDKDNLLAKASLASDTEAEALTHKNDLINAVQAGYNYTSLSFGWDIIDERKDAITNITWYHFLIKCNNVLYQKGSMQGKPLILFESIKGYVSKEEAMQAFLNNYLIILRKAFIPDSYGTNQFIGFTEILIHEPDDCTKELSTVFVPAETLYEYDGDIANTVKAIISIAKGYPVLYITKGFYRFSLFNEISETFDWRSTARYDTPQKAMQQFQLFLGLLKYSGNFYIEKNETDCRYRIYIREVLALSTLSFSTPELAWGINGVEKFICIAQTENGFHNYLNRTNCGYSFYVACDNTGLLHPCKYETPERRDKALNKLYQAASFNFFDLLQVDAQNNLSLLALDEKPVANLFIQTGDDNQFDKCEKLIEFFEAMYVDANYVQKDNTFYLIDANKNRIASPIEYNITWTEWKKRLLAVACYFPLYRKQTDNSSSTGNRSQCNFYIQIKLPEFNTCKDDLANDCPDKNSDDDCKPGCYIAWKSDCCFSSCCEALFFYASSLKLLSAFSNYKPVYECDCGYYGIELHSEEIVKSEGNVEPTDPAIYREAIGRWLCDDSRDTAGRIVDNQIRPDDYRDTNKCLSEIIAINPQQYNNATIACEAVERAKGLINAEGLHLVEHILLRPRCQNSGHIYDDCNCPYLPVPCIDTPDPNGENKGNICHFQWKPGGDTDFCEPEDPICFTPGCDPWSFIVTIALPAWPERFRTKENRGVIEKLLQKEAPAHVLLRILWLRPRDFCCFEYYFKNWNYWLAKKMCDVQYNNCDFLGLLFHKEFAPLAECNECVPCDCNKELPVSCFDEKTEDCPNFDLAKQLNNLYCWNKAGYDNYHCGNETDNQEPTPVPGAFVSVTNETTIQPKTVEIKTPAKPVKEAISSPATADLPEIDSREKYLTLQARASRYKENIKKIADAIPGNNTVENASRFLSDTNPDSERYEDLINKILKNKPDKTKKIKGLTIKEKNVLIGNISWQYFDRVCVNEKNADKISMHEALFNHLRKSKIDMKLLYDDWNPNELKSVEPGINFNEIKKAVI